MQKLFPICLALLALALWFGCSEETADLGAIPIEPVYFIDSVTPPDGATSVPVNYPIIITFLRAMDTATLEGNRFDLSGDAGYAYYKDKSRVRLVPNYDLQYNTEYTVTIMPGIADSLGNVMDTEYEWSFTTGLGSSFLESTYPVNEQTRVPLDAVIEATFKNEINPATINTNTFYLDNDVTGTVTYSNKVARFTPGSNLLADTTYTVTLTTDITDNSGTSMGSDYSWTFSTIFSDSIPPSMVRVSPVENETDVPANTQIAMIFNEHIDPASVNLQVTLSFGIDGVIHTVDSAVIFTLGQYLLNNQKHTVTFSGQVSDKSGNTSYINYTWSFTTGGGPEIVMYYPQPNSMNIPVDTTVWVTFTNDMDFSTINSGTFAVLDENDSLVSGIRTYSNKTATFTPSEDLLPNYTYKVILTLGVRDITNQPIPEELVWTFTTEAGPENKIISIFPNAGDTGVAFNSSVLVTFSNDLEPSTVNSSTFKIMDRNENQIVGNLIYENKTVSFTPINPFWLGQEYRVNLTSDICDIWNQPIESDTIWSFTTTTGPALMPLAVGNKWIYEVHQFGVKAEHKTYIDSIVIVKDTLMNSQIWYIDQHRNFFTQFHDRLKGGWDERPDYINFDLYFPSYTEYEEVDVSIPAGDFDCYKYSYEGGRSYYLWFAPDVGMAYYHFQLYWQWGQYDTEIVWKLLEYHLVE